MGHAKSISKVPPIYSGKGRSEQLKKLGELTLLPLINNFCATARKEATRLIRDIEMVLYFRPSNKVWLFRCKLFNRKWRFVHMSQRLLAWTKKPAGAICNGKKFRKHEALPEKFVTVSKFVAITLSCSIGILRAADFSKETFILDMNGPVPVELWIPKSDKATYPLIITQHGSTRDGHVFAGGKGQTDIYSTQLMQMAIERGFAVAAIDAFYEKGITPMDKTKFPNAAIYASKLRNHLISTYSNLDPKNTFYTGFSYGGDMAMNQLALRNNTPWTAIAPAEASCNSFFKPRKLAYQVLIVKGSESHYHPRACQIAVQEHQKIGNRVDLLTIEKVNHFFSYNGQIVKGLAFNGCSENPVIVDDLTGNRAFYDGTPTTREEINARCFTNQSGKGKSGEKLTFAIEKILDFFSISLVK